MTVEIFLAIWVAAGAVAAVLSYGLTFADSGDRNKAAIFAVMTFIAPPSVLYEVLNYRSGLRFR